MCRLGDAYNVSASAFSILSLDSWTSLTRKHEPSSADYSRKKVFTADLLGMYQAIVAALPPGQGAVLELGVGRGIYERFYRPRPMFGMPTLSS